MENWRKSVAFPGETDEEAVNRISEHAHNMDINGGVPHAFHGVAVSRSVSESSPRYGLSEQVALRAHNRSATTDHLGTGAALDRALTACATPNELRRMRITIMSQETKIDDLNHKLNISKRKMDEKDLKYDRDMGDLKGEVRELNASLYGLSRTVDGLNVQMRVRMNAFRQLADDYDHQKNINVTFLSDSEYMKKRNVMKENTGVKDIIAGLRRELQESSAKARDFEHAYTGQKGSNMILEQVVANLQAEVARVTDQNAQDNLILRQSAESEYGRANHGLRQQVAGLTGEVAAVLTERNQLLGNVEESCALRQEVARLSNELATVTAERDQLLRDRGLAVPPPVLSRPAAGQPVETVEPIIGETAEVRSKKDGGKMGKNLRPASQNIGREWDAPVQDILAPAATEGENNEGEGEEKNFGKSGVFRSLSRHFSSASRHGARKGSEKLEK